MKINRIIIRHLTLFLATASIFVFTISACWGDEVVYQKKLSEGKMVLINKTTTIEKPAENPIGLISGKIKKKSLQTFTNTYSLELVGPNQKVGSVPWRKNEVGLREQGSKANDDLQYVDGLLKCYDVFLDKTVLFIAYSERDRLRVDDVDLSVSDQGNDPITTELFEPGAFLVTKSANFDRVKGNLVLAMTYDANDRVLGKQWVFQTEGKGGSWKLTHEDVKEKVITPEEMENFEQGIQIIDMPSAIRAGDTKMVKELVGKGGDVNAKDAEDGLTPLMCAARHGDVELAQMVLDKGADLKAKDDGGRDAMTWALKSGIKGVVELLLAKGLDVNRTDSSGWTPLHGAVCFNQKEIVALLLGKGADLNAKDKEGTTPLMLAAARDNSEIVKLLLEKGAYVSSKDNYGKKAADHALEWKKKKMADLLKQEEDARKGNKN